MASRAGSHDGDVNLDELRYAEQPARPGAQYVETITHHASTFVP